MSNKPGIRYLPRPSMRRAPDGTDTLSTEPMCVIRPSLTRTVCPGSSRSLSMGTTVTSTKAKVPSVAGGAGCLWLQPSNSNSTTHIQCFLCMLLRGSEYTNCLPAPPEPLGLLIEWRDGEPEPAHVFQC